MKDCIVQMVEHQDYQEDWPNDDQRIFFFQGKAEERTFGKYFYEKKVIGAREQDTLYGNDMATKMFSSNKNRYEHAERKKKQKWEDN